MLKHALLALSAAACVTLLAAAPVAAAPSFDLSGLVQTAADDLNSAKADADARGDVLASTCYTAILDYNATIPVVAISFPETKGVASAFQTARDVVKDGQRVKALFSGGIPMPLKVGCGPLALDVQSDIGQAVADFSFLGLHF